MFQFPLSISGDYFPMINDLFRMGIIQVVTQLMFYFANPIENPFWSPLFLQTLLFLLIGVLAYWLIFRHIISVVPVTTTADHRLDGLNQETRSNTNHTPHYTDVGLLDSTPPTVSPVVSPKNSKIKKEK